MHLCSNPTCAACLAHIDTVTKIDSRSQMGSGVRTNTMANDYEQGDPSLLSRDLLMVEGLADGSIISCLG